MASFKVDFYGRFTGETVKGPLVTLLDLSRKKLANSSFRFDNCLFLPKDALLVG